MSSKVLPVPDSFSFCVFAHPPEITTDVHLIAQRVTKMLMNPLLEFKCQYVRWVLQMCVLQPSTCTTKLKKGIRNVVFISSS